MKKSYYKRRKRLDVKDRVLRKSRIPLKQDGTYDDSKCWLWHGGKNKIGYGLIKHVNSEGERNMMTVHRVMAMSCEIVPWYSKDEVQHTCTNYNCVNPKHLRKGTKQQRLQKRIKDHGSPFESMRANPYKKCNVCHGVSYFTWFNREHEQCQIKMNLALNINTKRSGRK